MEYPDISIKVIVHNVGFMLFIYNLAEEMVFEEGCYKSEGVVFIVEGKRLDVFLERISKWFPSDFGIIETP